MHALDQYIKTHMLTTNVSGTGINRINHNIKTTIDND
jgi:hypothetical protein